MLTFVLDPSESVGQRTARIAQEAVADGPMGRWLRGDRYGSFLDIWDMTDDYSRLIDAMHAGAVLAGVKTSCAVDASSVLGYSGRKLHKPWHADGTWGITSWLGLDFDHPAWFEPGVNDEPSVGDVFYRGAKSSPMGHVGIFAERLPSGLWRTVEGGGNLTPDDMRGMSNEHIKQTNGTVMRMTPPAGKDVFAPDSMGRHLTGWWRIDQIGLLTYDEIIAALQEANA